MSSLPLGTIWGSLLKCHRQGASFKNLVYKRADLSAGIMERKDARDYGNCVYAQSQWMTQLVLINVAA